MNELRLIRYALALDRHRNFARAAEAVHVTQPTLSRGIAELERWLGVPLFDRTRKGAVPTAFGRVLIERGEAVVRSEASLRREIELIADVAVGALAISAGPIASEVSVAAAIARVACKHPRLRIGCRTVEPDQVVRDVLDERVDVGVAQVSRLEHDERLDIRRLPPLRVYLACRPGHPLTRVRRLNWEQAMKYPLVTNVLRGAHAALVGRRSPRIASDVGVPDVVPQIVVNSPHVGRIIARESDALFPGTAGLIADDVKAGHLVRLPLEARALRSVHGIIQLRNRTPSPATRAFIDALLAVEAEIREREAAPALGADPEAADRRSSTGDSRRLRRRRGGI